MEEEKKILYNKTLAKAIILDSRDNYDDDYQYGKKQNIPGKTMNVQRERERLMKLAKYKDDLVSLENSDYAKNDWLEYTLDGEFISTMNYKRPSMSVNSSGHVSSSLVSDKYLYPEVYEFNDRNNIGSLRNIYFERK